MKRWFLVLCVVFVAARAADNTGGSNEGRQRGLVAHYFKDPTNWNGKWPDSQAEPSADPKDYTFTEYTYSRVEPLINHQFIHNGWFTIRWVGDFDPFPPGADNGDKPRGEYEYFFEIFADDGCRLTLDGQTLIESWQACCEKSEKAIRPAQPVKLAPGPHRIVVEYFQGLSLQHDDHDPMKLYWMCPARNVPRQVIPASHFSHTKDDLTVNKR